MLQNNKLQRVEYNPTSLAAYPPIERYLHKSAETAATLPPITTITTI